MCLFSFFLETFPAIAIRPLSMLKRQLQKKFTFSFEQCKIYKRLTIDIIFTENFKI